MSLINTKILNSIKVFPEFKEIPHKYIISGFGFLNSDKVKNVKVLSDNELIGNVKGNTDYTVKVTLKENQKLSFSCSCESVICEHQAAVVLFAKNNMELLENDYLANIPSPLAISNLKSLFERLTGSSNIYLNEKSLNQIKQISESVLKFVNIDDSLEFNELFLKVLDFLTLNQHLHLLNDKELLKKLEDSFLDKIHSCTPSFLQVWKKELFNLSFVDVFNLIIKSKESVDNQEKATKSIQFLENTLETVKKGKFYRNYNLNLDTEKQKILITLISLILNLMKNYSDYQAFRKYFEYSAKLYEDLENEYLLMLLSNNEEDTIINFIDHYKNHHSVGKILYAYIFYKRGKITFEQLEKQLYQIASEYLKLIDFNVIKKILTENEFEIIKDKLIKIAKRQDKFTYLEMEIFCDKERGFQLAKEAGVFEFNKHFQHFAKEKESEIITFYQSELTDFFSKNKGLGVKFHEAMSVIKNLMTLKGGKYYAFSIWLAAKDQWYYETSESLDTLYSYISDQDL